MKCWCVDGKSNKCAKCEHTVPAKNPILLKSYLRMLVKDIFNPDIPEHKEILDKLIKDDDDLSNLTYEEKMEINRHA